MPASSLHLLQGAATVPSLRLVLVHGFLGNSDDWRPLLPYLPETVDVHALDLPGHGILKDEYLPSLRDYSQFVAGELLSLPQDGVPIVLVGYSLGARIIMQGLVEQTLHSSTIKAVILEGGNFGLVSRSDREERWLNDCYWIERFKNEPIEIVLDAWYQQPVFSSLDKNQRAQLISQRRENQPKSLASVMSATSLAKQAYLLPELNKASVPVLYITGEKDSKFCQLYQQAGVQFHTVTDAGHNAHKEQPKRYVKKLKQLLFL